MVIDVKVELFVFWMIFLSGQLIGVIFDFFKVFRRYVKPRPLSIAIEDIVFCILSFKIFFDTVYYSNNGAFRWYIFAALILSIVLYFIAESVFVVKAWNGVFKFFGIILSPFIKIIQIFKKYIKKAKNYIFPKVFRVWNKIRQKTTKKTLKPQENSDVI